MLSAVVASFLMLAGDNPSEVARWLVYYGWPSSAGSSKFDDFKVVVLGEDIIDGKDNADCTKEHNNGLTAGPDFNIDSAGISMGDQTNLEHDDVDNTYSII